MVLGRLIMTTGPACTCTGDPMTPSCDHRPDCPLYVDGLSHADAKACTCKWALTTGEGAIPHATRVELSPHCPNHPVRARWGHPTEQGP